jgi:hypothetical protein
MTDLRERAEDELWHEFGVNSPYALLDFLLSADSVAGNLIRAQCGRETAALLAPEGYDSRVKRWLLFRANELDGKGLGA